MRLRWVWAGVAVIASVALLYFFNPIEHSFYPRCLFHAVTGWDCPGCGGLRATHQLLHGNVAAAFRLNPLLVCSVPIGVVFAIRWWLVRKKTKPQPYTRNVKWAVACAIFVVAFGVLRNLPWRRWME